MTISLVSEYTFTYKVATYALCVNVESYKNINHIAIITCNYCNCPDRTALVCVCVSVCVCVCVCVHACVRACVRACVW